MIVAEKAGAWLADAVPSVFETREAVFVERHRTSGAIERAKDAVVPHGQRAEGKNGHGEQPGRDAGAEHEPGGQCERGNGGKARVADARVEAGEARMFRCARRPPFAIFT